MHPSAQDWRNEGLLLLLDRFGLEVEGRFVLLLESEGFGD